MTQMKDDNDQRNQFKTSIKKTHGVEMSDEDAKTALENLVNFFDLLHRFDQEDKQKSKQMEVIQNGERI